MAETLPENASAGKTDLAVFKAPYPPSIFPPNITGNFDSFNMTVGDGIPNLTLIQNLFNALVAVPFQQKSLPILSQIPSPIDENFIALMDSLTPRNLVKKPGKLRTDVEYKQWNAQRQRQNRRKLTETLHNCIALYQRLRAELVENAIVLRKMLFHDQAKVDARLRVTSFLGLAVEIIEGIPEFQRILTQYTEKRAIISEMDVEPKSNFFDSRAIELHTKYTEYKRTRVESRIPADLKKKMNDAIMRSKCYSVFMDSKRVKKVIKELQINETELKQSVEDWLQTIVQQMRELLTQQLPTIPVLQEPIQQLI